MTDLTQFSALLHEHGTLYHAALRQPRIGELRGRGVAIVAELAGGACVVRHYHRGGAMAGVLGDKYPRGGRNRVLRELQASEVARARGVPTPEVRCGAWYEHGVFRRFDIATSYIPDSRDLAHVLFGDAAAADAAVSATADLIRALLHAGLIHNDLNLKNILITEERAYILDLDRCHIADQVSPVQARAMRDRFFRSLIKWETQAGKRAPASMHVMLREAFNG